MSESQTEQNVRASTNPMTNQPVYKTSMSKAKLLGLIALATVVIVLGIYLWFQSESGPDLAWMAWTKPTAIFFLVIIGLLISMSVWEMFSPGGGPRVGILRFETTRGDRLFLSLLGSAFITLGWLGWVDADLWKALGVCLIYALLVFGLV